MTAASCALPDAERELCSLRLLLFAVLFAGAPRDPDAIPWNLPGHVWPLRVSSVTVTESPRTEARSESLPHFRWSSSR